MFVTGLVVIVCVVLLGPVLVIELPWRLRVFRARRHSSRRGGVIGGR